MKTNRRSFLGGLFGAAFLLSDEGEVIAEPERVRTYSFLPGDSEYEKLCEAVRKVYRQETLVFRDVFYTSIKLPGPRVRLDFSLPKVFDE
jgi:hypothetical protein